MFYVKLDLSADLPKIILMKKTKSKMTKFIRLWDFRKLAIGQ